MAYIGNQIRQYSDRVVLDSLTASATANYTLQLNGSNYVPSSAESLTVSLNGIIQKPQNSYTVSGSTLSFASALTASDSIDFVIAERGITLQTPSAGSVNTEQLASNAVTTAKIADANVTSAKMFSGFANGITQADQWRITASTTPTDGSFILANWERSDTGPFSIIVTGLTESSGIFSFPETGIYYIISTGYWSVSASNSVRFISFRPHFSTNGGSTYDVKANTYGSIASYGGTAYGFTIVPDLIDVTDISQFRMKFQVENTSNVASLVGSTNYPLTNFSIMRIGNT